MGKTTVKPGAIVIGASSGIGRETARLLANVGTYSKVGITGRRGLMLEDTAQVNPDRFEIAVFEATDEDALNELGCLINTLGDVELIVVCSGTGEVNETLDEAVELETVKLNVEAFTRIVGYAYNYLEVRGGGSLAAVTSVMGLRGSRGAPAYAASKAYQINYLEGLRQKARRDKSKVTVTDIRPGSVRTDMMKGEGHFWISEPYRAAELVVESVNFRRKVCYVSRRWAIVGMLLKILPRRLYERM